MSRVTVEKKSGSSRRNGGHIRTRPARTAVDAAAAAAGVQHGAVHCVRIVPKAHQNKKNAGTSRLRMDSSRSSLVLRGVSSKRTPFRWKPDASFDGNAGADILPIVGLMTGASPLDPSPSGKPAPAAAPTPSPRPPTPAAPTAGETAAPTPSPGFAAFMRNFATPPSTTAS